MLTFGMLRLAAAFFVIAAVVSQSPTTLTIARIDANGLHRYALTDIVRVSGLRVGQTVAVKDLDTAVAQMATTGFFKRVQYRVDTSSGRTVLTFDIAEETDWSVPVVFDNFIWMPDEELAAAVRDAVPAYDGTAPVSGPVPEVIKRALAIVLQQRNVAGDVDYRAAGKLDGSNRRHVFSVINPAPFACTLHFDGASAIKEAELLKTASDVVGRPFSRSYLWELSQGTLTQLYQKRGYWKASFQVPATTPVDSAKCHGADVTIRVDEGLLYRMGSLSTPGLSGAEAKRLTRTWKLKSGAVFDASYLNAFKSDLARTDPMLTIDTTVLSNPPRVDVLVKRRP